jgi:hypothetical protein
MRRVEEPSRPEPVTKLGMPFHDEHRAFATWDVGDA